MQSREPHRLISQFVCIIAVLALASSAGWSQQVAAAITGRVTDPSGSTIPNAKVTATDTERGSTFATVSNNEGIYDLPRLPVGTYNVRVEGQGFQTAQQSNVLLVLNQTAKLDFQLQIGSASQSVEVNSTAPLLPREHHSWITETEMRP